MSARCPKSKYFRTVKQFGDYSESDEFTNTDDSGSESESSDVHILYTISDIDTGECEEVFATTCSHPKGVDEKKTVFARMKVHHKKAHVRLTVGQQQI